MKVYRGVRSGPRALVYVDEGLRAHALHEGFEHVRHSPDGFNWGYTGSGPAQLAFALCLDALGNPKFALAVYHLYKCLVVSRLEKDTWKLTEQEVRDAIRLEVELEVRRQDARRTRRKKRLA